MRKRVGRRKGEEEVFRGTSLVDEVEIELPQEEGKEQEPPVREPIPVRYLLVHASQLERQHHRALQKSIAKEKEVLSKALEKLQKRPFSCKEDALREAAQWTKSHKPGYHQVSFETLSSIKKAKREKKGRPGKEEQPRLVEEWVLEGRMERNTATVQEQAPGYFVLATDHLDPGEASDATILEWSKEQEEVEGGLSWLKGPAAFAPIFLGNWPSERRVFLGTTMWRPRGPRQQWC